ncbi:MAG TPA: hypothetical protein VEQ41_10105 [Solirubrobacterales bacterium]|nr:hypothetical protein [Solirubrobacterales bacterium]
MTGREQRIADLRRGPGELSFEARIGDDATRVEMRADGDFEPNAEAALAACLMPAMRFGGTLEMPEAVSPRVLRNQREFQAVQRAWSLEWPFGDPQLEEVEVRAPTRVPPPGRKGRVAAFFSGGVDSWSTVLDHPELTDLIFIRGFDLRDDWEHQAGLVDEVEARLRQAAAELDMPLHVVSTNLRELSDPLARWETYFGCATVAVAHFMAPLFERVLIAGDSDHEVQVPVGASRLVSGLWSSEAVEIVEDGGRFSRIERLRRIASHPLVHRTLRVCWRNLDGAYNCGRCRKCMLTMVPLEAIGALDRVSTFSAALDVDRLVDEEIDQPVSLTLWEDVLDCVREARRDDLEPAVEEFVERGKRRLGLPPSYRRRRSPGPPPLRPEAKRRHREALAAAEGQRDAAAELATVLGSRSWRLTSPLRGVGLVARRLRRRRDGTR